MSPRPRPVRQHALLPLTGSLALHGLAAAALAVGGWLWLAEQPERKEPPQVAVAVQEDRPQVEFAPPSLAEVEPPAELPPEIVESEAVVHDTLLPESSVEMLMPHPPLDFHWQPTTATPAPPEPAEPREAPQEPGESTKQSETQESSAPSDPAVAVEAPQVDTQDCPPPDYPRGARRRGQQGVVEVLVQVEADGGVGGVSLHRSSGHRLLDDAALKAVRNWSFHAGRNADGDTVAAELVVPVRFRLED